MTHYSLGLYLLGLLLLADVSVSQLRRSSKSSGSVSSGVSSSGSSSSSSSSGTSASQIVDFDCPEEFGYYPHPGDCTQYYVCVFGGALLESCTGGLMYSHELQTCDWPRNVGCGEAVSAVSTVKAVESRPRQPIQLRPQHQPQQLQAQQQQQQQQRQQYVQQRPLQRDEAIPKHHLYAEEDLGPAEEVESDRQQRVYRGQPATLGQVARDRDGLSRHSNALQVSPANGREKLSVISFGTQQQYSRQTIQPAPYVEPTTTQRVTSRGYNTTQHQQYTPSPYDPYYNIYEDDTDLYKDIDYSQYTGQQYQAQPAYKEKQSQVPQQQVQTTPSRKPSIQYSPPPPPPQPQQSYNTVQQDDFSQAVAQDYNDNYNLQDEDIDYKQSDLDLKNNRSRPLQPQEESTIEGKKIGGTENHQNTSRNRQLTLTAAFSFDDEKTPVTSSKRFEENARQRSSISSFQVEEPPSTGPLRETHEIVLSYIRQENEKDRLSSEEENKTEIENVMEIKQSFQKETLPKNNPKPFAYYPDDNKANELYSTISPTQDTPVLSNVESKLRSARPFRIIVPSTTENAHSDQITLRPRLTSRRGNKVQIDTSETGDQSRDATVRPYKLPHLSRESLSSRTAQVVSSLTESTMKSKIVQGHSREDQTSSTQIQTEKGHLDSSDDGTKAVREFDDEIIKFIPIVPQRTSNSKNIQQEKFEADKINGADQFSSSRESLSPDMSLVTRGRDVVHQRISTVPQVEESSLTVPSLGTRGRDVVHQRVATAPQVEESSLTDPSLGTRGRDVVRQRIATAQQVEESSLNAPNLGARGRDVARQRVAIAPHVEESSLTDSSLGARGRDVVHQKEATAQQVEESTLTGPSLETRDTDVVHQRIATDPQVEESSLTDPSLGTRSRDVARQRVAAPQVEESSLTDPSQRTRGRDVARQRVAAPQVKESSLTDPTLGTRGRDVVRQRIATASQVEDSTSTDRSLGTRGRDVARQRIVTQYISTTPQAEESIFKFIPINAVRKRLPNQDNNKNVFPNDEKFDSITQQRKAKENITVNKYQANLSQNKERNPQLTPQIVSTNKNLFSYQDILFEENIRTPDNNQISNGRTHSRFSQTTETPVRRPLYSLRTDSESGKFNGPVNNVVLPTLETIPHDNTRSEMTQKIIAQNVELTNLGRKSEQVSETLNKGDNEEDNINYYNGNNYSDQIRIRNQGKTVATNTDTKVDEYRRPTAYTTTTDFPDNEPVLLPVRARIRTRPKQNKAESENSSYTYLSSEPQNLTEKQEHIPVTRDYTTVTSTEEIYKNRNNTNFSDLQSRFNSNLETNNKEYLKRRQLNNRNRLSPVLQDQDSGILQEDAIFDSEEETFSINNKITTESDQTVNDRFASRGTQSWHTAADEPLETEDDDDSEYVRKFTNERQQNTRQMHIKKRIRFTTLQPQTQKYDSYNSIKSRTTTTNPINDNLTSSIENRLSVPLVDEVHHKINKETDSPYIVNRPRNWSVTKTKNVDDDQNKYQREKNYQFRRGDQTQVKSRNNTDVKSSTPVPAVEPYTLIRQPSSLQEQLPNTRPYTHESTNSQLPSNVIARNESTEERPTIASQTYSPLAAEINSYFKEVSTSTTSNYTPVADDVDIKNSTTVSPSTTFEKIRDKFRLGSFPKPTPSSHGFARKPSVEDSTPPPLPSDRCSQELDNDSECNDKPVLRLRPTSASPDSEATPGLARGGSRNRGSATYTVSPNEANPVPSPNRGTPSSLSRNRPTLKPSTSIVSKAAEFIDIYRYPASRPEPIYPTPQVDKTAAKCRKDVCLLPDCSCGGKEIPGDLTLEQTPQIVLLTFDDSVNDLNKGLYSDLFEKGRTNPNGCPIAATFYVSHEWTDYSQVQNLYAGGHEMASHSVSHSFGEQFSVKKWTKEIAGQREILSAYGGVRLEDIRGMRAPFLSIGGNKMFKMLYDANFTYDSSMPVYENKPPSWPYTLDYKIFHDCMIPPCPTRSYPGVWEVPMVMWQDLNGGRCSMGDACSNPPTADGVYKMLIKNFERHFTSNRAPFGLFYHAAWFTQPHHKEGFIAFLDAITKMPEVWLVTNWQAVQWVRDPTPISRLNSFAPFQCNYPERPRRCNNPKVCNLWHKSGVRYMRTCQPCPEIYPWTGKSGVRNSRVDNEIITE